MPALVCPKAWRRSVRLLIATVMLATASWDVAAQSVVCDTVRPGDTVSAVAQRLTGRADSYREPWFRIFDRANSRVIRSARYDRVVAGSQACIPAARFAPRVSRSSWQSIAPRQPISGGNPPSRDRALELVLFCFGTAVFGAAMGCMWETAEQVATRRRALKREMESFGDMFVQDFERPLLVDGAAARPIHARLRCNLRDRRLDVLLAPAVGRRYPNLDDHRQNVEYDVDRIARRLRQHPFVRRPLRTEGQWVVIPFEFKPNLKTGAVV